MLLMVLVAISRPEVVEDDMNGYGIPSIDGNDFSSEYFVVIRTIVFHL